ncbi:MAG: hypothetical protein IT166_20830 [Bryobacterales bacterium]|nr:hypothetical protein [Bryobacterales bacterium]
MRIFYLACVFGGLLVASTARGAGPEKFIRLVEFQVWADWRGPEVPRLLSNIYNRTGKSHNFQLPHHLFLWNADRMRGWVDEAVKLGCFNLFNLGDDTRAAEGYLFNDDGLNPIFRDFYLNTVAYAHSRGMMVGVEPRALPRPVTRENIRKWAGTFLDPSLGKARVTDVIKMSIEWLDAYKHNPEIAEETEAFIEGIREVNPEVLVYVDSMTHDWGKPRAYHYWLMARYPKIIISHYLNSEQVPAFRAAGAANMMVQINPQEYVPENGQFFVYHDRTVKMLKDVVTKKVSLLSIAGVNYGYQFYNYDLFLDILRPHVNLAGTVAGLRAGVKESHPARHVTKADVRAEEAAARR